jgi:DNA polymerase-3 subunit delta'
MAFEIILGQPQAKHILQRALAHGSLSHAYLFYGPESVGKRKTAFELAKALICQETGAAESCGTCAACRKIEQSQHPDVFYLEPQKAATSREAAIKIDDIRELQKKLGFLPYEAPVKVAIVDGVDRMNPQAANAFLKTLEEPPSSTVLILLTAQPQLLLPTMISRCQGIRFHALPQSDLIRILEPLAEEAEVSEEELPLRAARSGGRVNPALDADHAEWLEIRRALAVVLRELSYDRIDHVFAFGRLWGKETDRAPKLLEEMSSLIRDAALVKLGCSADHLMNPDLAGPVQQIAAAHSRRGLLKMHEQTLATRQALQGNANLQLALECLLLDFCEAA